MAKPKPFEIWLIPNSRELWLVEEPTTDGGLMANGEPGVSEAAAVSTAPPGATPRAAMAEQIELRAVVKAVDPETHSVTLDVPGGGERTVKLGAGIDLEKVKAGELVSVTLTRALAISIDKQ